MKTDDPKKYPLKMYCYKTSECKVVETGFLWNDIKVCKTCKCELSDSLYNSIKERENKTTTAEEDEMLRQIDLMWEEHQS